MNMHRNLGRWSSWVAAIGASALMVAACATAEDDSSPLQPDGSAGVGGVSGSGGSGASGGGGGSAGTTTGGSGGTAGAAEDGGSDASAGAAGSGGDAGASGTGGAAGDAGTDADAGPCTPNTVQTESCGKCGKRDRLCDATGKWGDWGFCYGETGECVPNTQLSEACGKCGTITYYCSASCIYLPGPCTNEGTCTPGEVTVSNAGCAAGEVRTALCSNSCSPGTFGNCSTQYTWSIMAPSPLSGRRQASSTWNGQYVVFAGGYGGTPLYKNDAGLYDPATNQWVQLPPWPASMVGRREPALAASSSYIVIWGGYGSPSPYNKDDGAVYSFATQTWTSMSKVGYPGGRYEMAYAWDDTAQQLLVFGGYSTTYTNTLHAYKPATDTWTTLPIAPIAGRREMAFAWDPVRRWLYVFGGYGSSPSYKEDGAIYDAAANEWRLLPPVPVGFTGRERAGAAVASDKFVIFGGYGSSPTYKLDGLVYDPITHKWSKLPTPPLSARTELFSASDGTSAFFWGGREATTAVKDDGAIFNPATMTWTGVTFGPLVQSPSARYLPTGAWTPSGIVVWSGSPTSSTYANDGRVYEP